MITAFFAFVKLIRLSIYVFMGAIIIQAVLSWVNPHHPVAPFFQALTRPFLRPFQRAVPSVPGQEQPDKSNDHPADCGKPDDQVPGSRGVAERVGKVVPEPVLHVVDEGEKDRCRQRGRNAH